MIMLVQAKNMAKVECRFNLMTREIAIMYNMGSNGTKM